MSRLPLEGIIVIDFSTLIAAPVAGTFLADFGAEVIKVEMPKVGDPSRTFKLSPGRRSGVFLVDARNKKSITLDLHTPEGQEIARKLCTKVDVTLFNFRPERLQQWNLDPDSLHAINLNLIICVVSGYGQTGPYRNKPGFDRTISAFAGLTDNSGYPEHPPVRCGYPVVDYMSGYLGAYAIMVALYNREVNHAGGEVIDLSLAEVAFRATGGSLPMYSQSGIIKERDGNRISFVVPAENFETKDNCHITLNAGTAKLWRNLAHAMNKPELLTDSRFATHFDRIQNQDELYLIIGDWLKEYTAEEAVELLEAVGVPVESINNIADLAEDPHMREREAVIPMDDPDNPGKGEILVPGIVPKLKNFPGKIKSLGPELGEHNQEVYGTHLGLSDKEIKQLEEKGVI